MMNFQFSYAQESNGISVDTLQFFIVGLYAMAGLFAAGAYFLSRFVLKRLIPKKHPNLIGFGISIAIFIFFVIRIYL